ncbi:amidohydrolase family protein [Pelotomaculum terephthalicicum JT]|uniref:adenine deaminase C-terminal domain-containing protein n=1 Tax=Pelotomaculum terephthalicicum TaxID=206393 RepID=UPI001F03E5AA|nr:adenine deaminase C-terminal domain-containing protein [Pelotomaculum terephthalicicum]MCG9967418.1 amidohydrolase family protein [Pelotomaculum terephthalicicum JT]
MPSTVKGFQELLNVSAGRQEASYYLKGGSLINVLSGEIYLANTAIWQDKIAYVGKSEKMVGANTTIVDARGFYLCPALIEPHCHPWEIYNPVNLAEASLLRGITTIIYDNLFFFVYLGTKGFLKMMDLLDNLPARIYWMARVIHQSPDINEEHIFSIANLEELFSDPRIIKIGEINRWPLIVKGDYSLLEKIILASARHKGFEGHTAGCSYDHLNVIAAAGAESCHESITAEDVAQRLRLGFWTMLRHSSLRPDLPELLRAITEMRLPTNRMLFTTDGSRPSFIAREGLIDGMLRIAVKAGINPVTALQMSTINAATYLGMEKDLGSIAPGRQADILLLPDLEKFIPHMVLSKGKIVAIDGKLSATLTAPDWGEIGFRTELPRADFLKNTSLFGVPSAREKVFPVINFVSTVITKRQDRLLKQCDGLLEREDDLLYCTLIDRFGKWVTNGFVSGLGQLDAVASTYNSSYNLLVLGMDRSSMALAASEVTEMNGGIVLVKNGQVSFRMPLKIGGMASDRSFATIVSEMKYLEDEVRKCGYHYNDFFYTMLFLVCDFLPGLRITAAGIIDVKKQQVIVPTQKLL